MTSKLLRLLSLALLVPVFAEAGGRDSVRQEMRFGAEAAQRGLWREASFRWEKILASDPDNARVHNNLAVASESLGQFERARVEYEAARRLDPNSKEIRSNYESFQQLCRTIKSCGGDSSAAPAAGPAVSAPSPAAAGDAAQEPAAGSATPVPSPSPGGV